LLKVSEAKEQCDALDSDDQGSLEANREAANLTEINLAWNHNAEHGEFCVECGISRYVEMIKCSPRED
jgi:hypothetical protein